MGRRQRSQQPQGHRQDAQALETKFSGPEALGLTGQGRRYRVHGFGFSTSQIGGEHPGHVVRPTLSSRHRRDGPTQRFWNVLKISVAVPVAQGEANPTGAVFRTKPHRL